MIDHPEWVASGILAGNLYENSCWDTPPTEGFQIHGKHSSEE